MTAQKFIDVVHAVAYKPGYQFDASPEEDFVRVALHTPPLEDRTRSSATIRITFSRAIALYDIEHQGEDFARYWIRKFVLDWEEHEMTEWLRIDGRRVDPHGETEKVTR